MGWTGRITRLARHRWRDDARRELPREVLQRLRQRIVDSEKRHSGEIRVYIEAGLPTSYILREASARERAIAIFGELRVWDTQQNNGVLIYLLLPERAIELVADRGLTARVPESEWQRIVQAMGNAFRERRHEDGLNQAVDAVTALLVRHFPLTAGERNPNELPDEPVLG